MKAERFPLHMDGGHLFQGTHGFEQPQCPPHCVNIFMPLVDVTADNGPTELRPGSHEWVDTPYGREPRWDERRQSSVTPILPRPAQDLLLFDYRVYHRGRANRSLQSRPVLRSAGASTPGRMNSQR